MKKKIIIQIENLTYSFNNKDNIFENISFNIIEGDLIAIIGPNGTGKSTLVKLICNLLENQKGTIKVNGKISYIPQKYNQDLNFPAKVKELFDLECCDCDLRKDTIKYLGLEKLENLQFKNLSGGQQQRVLLALAILSNPQILILDEPTVGIDIKTQEEFYKLLAKLNKEKNMTILFITHDTGMLSNYFNKLICINNKKIYLDEGKNIDKLLKESFSNSFHEIHHKH